MYILLLLENFVNFFPSGLEDYLLTDKKTSPAVTSLQQVITKDETRFIYGGMEDGLSDILCPKVQFCAVAFSPYVFQRADN